jgi:3-deoxy-7-phosphoheptulonate synthase
VGADGAIIEVHPCPEEALSDGMQSLSFGEFAALQHDVVPYVALRGSEHTRQEAALGVAVA